MFLKRLSQSSSSKDFVQLFQTSKGSINWLALITAAGVLYVFFVLLRAFYNVFFHPLRSYPGPKLWAASRLPWNWVNLHGRLAWNIRGLHEKYGPVVRIAPDELSYATGTAWKTIYGHRPTGEMSKCLDGRGIAPPSINGVKALVTETQERHARLRRAILPAFSERALRGQEDFIQHYSGLLIKQLHKHCVDGPQDMVRWYALTTLDIVGDLAFGQSLEGLEHGDHEWIRVTMERARSITWFQLIIYYGYLPLLEYLAPRKTIKARRKHLQMISATVQERVAGSNADRKDFMSYILENTTEKLTNLELVIMASVFVIAGTRTTASSLSATTFRLLRNPDKYKRLVEEIRTHFKSEEEINMISTQDLPYLRAVISEGMRIYPPSPPSLPRFVPGKGDVIDGRWVPGGTAVGVHQLSASHNESNFKHAKSFIPERWLDEGKNSEFANDDKNATQPFSFGPRNCIGQNMAWSEMRMILSKVFLNFDLELVDNSDAWLNQNTYLVWEQPPLMVNLKPR